VPVTPIVVVGLGGTGMKALLQLKRLVAENRPGGMADLPALRLICLDSDDLVKPVAPPDPSVPLVALGLDPVSEYLKLEIPGNVGYQDLDRARAWFPKELEYYIPDLATGCKQYKALGRLLFAWNHRKVLRLFEPLRNMIDSTLLKQLGVSQLEDPLVFVISSVCGGTGAGMFLDTGYLLTNLLKRRWSRFNSKVCALLALPSVFAEVSQGSERIRSNAYASVKELDHYMNKDVYSDPELAFRTDYPFVEQVETHAFAPFDRVFLFDNGNGRVSVSASQVYEMMARYVYLMACGELTQEYLSVDNNLNPKVRGTNRVLNKPTCYSSFGYYSVVFPTRVAVQLASADLALDAVESELASSTAARDVDEVADRFLTSNEVFFSNQTPQILHTLSFYKDASGQRSNIQDVIGSTVAGIDLGNESPESYEGIVREYDTRFTNSELALFEADCRRQAESLHKTFRAALEAEIQKLADPAQKGSAFQVHLFLEELHKEMAEDVAALETLRTQTEKQVPGLKSTLEKKFLELRETAQSRSLFTRFTLQNTMAGLLAQTRETLEASWRSRRKAAILRQAVAFLKGDPASPAAELRSGAIDLVLAERDAYRRKIAVLSRMKEQLLEVLRRRRSVPDGEFSKVAFDHDRDVKPLIDEVKGRRQGLPEVRRRLHAPDCLGSDLDGLVDLSFEEAWRRLLGPCDALFKPAFDAEPLDARLASMGDLPTRVKTWLNLSRPFILLDSVDASKYAYSEEHNSARFIAIPHTYAGKPCEQLTNRCPVSGPHECDRWNGCLKRSTLEALPRGTGLGHMAGRHEVHFLSLVHGFAASSLISLVADCASIYRNHVLGGERIHMLGPVALRDLRESFPNRTLERLKDHFYLAYACGWTAWDEGRQTFLFRTDADLELSLPPSVELGPDIGSVLDNYHTPQAATAEVVRSAFESIARRLIDRAGHDPRGLGSEVLAFVKRESGALDDDEKRRLYALGKELLEGRCSSI
jgi:hypothetical protein